MPTYTINAHLSMLLTDSLINMLTHGASIAPYQLKKMDEGQYSLCLAKVMSTDSNGPGEPSPVSNVVAASYIAGGTSDQLSLYSYCDKCLAYGNNSLFEWEETYGIAANSATYQQGQG
jgi:hypothetical protein